jgi:hypothetical protein
LTLWSAINRNLGTPALRIIGVHDNLNGLRGSVAKAADVGTKSFASKFQTATAYNNARKLVFDPLTGALHLVYTTGPAPGSLTYGRSTDKGNTWPEVTPALLWGGHPALDVDTTGTPYVVENWAGIGSGFNARRRLGPGNWFKYNELHDRPGFGVPSIAVDSNGRLHIAISHSATNGIRYYWADLGGTINGPETIPPDGAESCQFPSIALDNNGVPQVVWKLGKKIIRYSYRKGAGSWSDRWDLESTAAIGAGPPSIAAHDDVLHVVWQEQDDKGGSFVNYATSPAGANNWGEKQVCQLSSSAVEAYPQVVSGDSLVCVVWADIVGSNYDIFYSQKTSVEPISWSNPVNLSNTPSVRSQHPQAAIMPESKHPGPHLPPCLCVVWTEGNGPNYQIGYALSPLY